MSNGLFRFFVLEDDDTHFQKLRSLLSRIVFESTDDSSNELTIEVVRVSTGCAPTRRVNSTDMAGPLTIAKDSYTRCIGKGSTVDKIDWKAGHTKSPIQLVSWIPSVSSKGQFLPHAVVLDILDKKESKVGFTDTRNALKAMGYPSDLVWIISGFSGDNELFGRFFPKSDLENSILIAHLSAILRVHQRALGVNRPVGARRRLSVARRRGQRVSKQEVRTCELCQSEIADEDRTCTTCGWTQGTVIQSYLPREVETFTLEFLQQRSWRQSIQVTLEVKTPLLETVAQLWGRADGDGEGALDRVRWGWRIAEHPAAGKYTFFTKDLCGEKQADYTFGRTFGLPIGFIVDNQSVKTPESVFVHAAGEVKNPFGNAIRRFNCCLFLIMTLGTHGVNNLNLSVPALELSWPTLDNYFRDALYHALPRDVITKRSDEESLSPIKFCESLVAV